ncbi:hypothetical protein F4801DRAFT_287775 [Xylaria longipes]|nr:hypothetical protein F4801DRAFT_287775 [Xylaria longipes]RYC56340.1 hypothetical protein CHU98_g9863 [Xylaria longipes]
MPPQETKTVYLKAAYASSTQPEPQLFSSAPLPLLPASKEIIVSEKTSYLSSLRAATIVLQESVNAALTARMEEDAACAQVASADKGREAAGERSKGADEVAEEENYGEEVPEDDA